MAGALLAPYKLVRVVTVLSLLNSWLSVCCGGAGLGLGVISWVRFSKNLNCLGILFNVTFVAEKCSYIRVETASKGHMAYARNVSSNEENFQNVTCANQPIVVDKNHTGDPQRKELSICFPSDQCHSSSSCQLIVICVTNASKDQIQRIANVTQLMCSEQEVDINSTSKPVTDGAWKTPFEVKPSALPTQNHRDIIQVVALVIFAISCVLFLVSVIIAIITNIY